MKFLTQPYPLNSLPDFMHQSAWEVHHFVQCSHAQVGMAFVAGMVITCQGLVDFKSPLTGKPRSIGINQMIVSESGDRTTTSDAFVLAPIFQHDARAVAMHEEMLKAYRANRTMWMNMSKSLSRRLVKLKTDGKDTTMLEAQIAEHQRQEPIAPRLRRLIRQDITARSSMDALAGHNETLSFVTDEGQTLFGSDIMRHVGKLNSFWDGTSPLSLDRANGETIIARDARVSMYFKAHEPVLKRYIKKYGEIARGAGLWARFLVSKPESLKGQRVVIGGEFKSETLPDIHARMMELMAIYDEKILSGPFERDVVELSDDAKDLWFHFAKQVEHDQKPGSWLHDVSDHASKFMENVGRLAATFHYFSGAAGKISAVTLRKAQEIVFWHMYEYVRLFSAYGALSPAHAAAGELIDHLLEHFWEGPGKGTKVPRSKILTSGPEPVRNAAGLNAALHLLQADNIVSVFKNPEENQKEYFLLQDWYFSQRAMRTV